MKYEVLCLFTASVVLSSCGPSHSTPENYVQLEGSTQVMAEGTRSETVIFEDFETGDRYALTGELASELVPQYGLTVFISAVPAEEGFSADPDLPKLKLLDYAIVSSEEDYLE